MKTHLRLVALLAVSAAALAGCAATASPDWDARFGDRLRAMNAQQLIDAQAPAKNAQATQAVDGRTTREAIGRHVEAARNPPQPNVLGIGTRDSR